MLSLHKHRDKSLISHHCCCIHLVVIATCALSLLLHAPCHCCHVCLVIVAMFALSLLPCLPYHHCHRMCLVIVATCTLSSSSCVPRHHHHICLVVVALGTSSSSLRSSSMPYGSYSTWWCGVLPLQVLHTWLESARHQLLALLWWHGQLRCQE